MTRTVLIIVSLLFAAPLFSQYYFQDIVTANNSTKNFTSLKKNGVKKVMVASIEPDGEETEGFGITQTIDAGKNMLVTKSVSPITGSSELKTTFDAAGQPVQLLDSSANTVNTVRYSYDNSGRLLVVNSHSTMPDDTNRYTIEEDHLFQYNAKGQLTGMLKITNKFDTLRVVFVPSENGLPGEERWYKKNRKTETWYYFYDDKKRLTDIVRFNETAQKMLPDYVFEYDDTGNITQQTVVQAGTNFYRLWLYDYNEKGLKKSETIFKKGKEQEGRIIYTYE
jgi:YD repeat-containing protein